MRSLAAVFADPKTIWCRNEVAWYGGKVKQCRLLRGDLFVIHPRADPSTYTLRAGALRGGQQAYGLSDRSCGSLLLFGRRRYHADRRSDRRFLCEPMEYRSHFRGDTGAPPCVRHWSGYPLAGGAIERTTPCLFGLFSLVVLMAQRLHPQTLPLQESGWYSKEEATFSDVLAAVRGHLWSARNNMHSPEIGQTILIPTDLWRQVQQVLAYAA